MNRSNYLIGLLFLSACAQTPTGTPAQCNVPLSNFSAQLSSFTPGLTTYNQMILAIGSPTLVLTPNSSATNYEYQIFDPFGDYCGEYMFYFAEGSCVTSTAPNNVTSTDCSGILQSFSSTPASSN